jgi:hypothetical protein
VQTRREPILDLNVLLDESPKDLAKAGDGVVQNQVLRPRNLTTAERQKLPRQRICADRGAADPFERFSSVWIRRHTCRRQVAAACNHGEQVVEVVRNAAGQAPDRLHFLGLSKVLLQVLLRRDVHSHANRAHWRFLVIADRPAEADYPVDRPVRPLCAVLNPGICAVTLTLSDLLEHLLTIIGMNRRDERVEGPAEAAWLQAMQPLQHLRPDRSSR